MSAAEPPLLEALRSAWGAVRALPDADADFTLTPAQRREAHDLGVRVQDRLVRALSKLVEDMATDGADLVDARGVPVDYGLGSEP